MTSAKTLSARLDDLETSIRLYLAESAAERERWSATMERLDRFLGALERRYPVLLEAEALNRAEADAEQDRDGARAELTQRKIVN